VFIKLLAARCLGKKGWEFWWLGKNSQKIFWLGRPFNQGRGFKSLWG